MYFGIPKFDQFTYYCKLFTEADIYYLQPR